MVRAFMDSQYTSKDMNPAQQHEHVVFWTQETFTVLVLIVFVVVATATAVAEAFLPCN
jgi:hypothetical protein